MSRSKKKPYSSYVCYKSNKWAKRYAHKSFRVKERQALKGTKAFPYKMREVSDVWCFPSDGLPVYIMGGSRPWGEEWVNKVSRK